MPERTRQFNRLLVEAVVLPVVLLAGLAGLLLWQVLYLQELNHWVDRTDVVIGRMNRLERLVVDRESDVRGFLLEGDEVLLPPPEPGSPPLHRALLELRALEQDSTSQLARLDTLEQLIARLAVASDARIEARRRGGPTGPPAGTIITAERSLDELRDQARQFILYEEGLRAQRVAKADQVTRLVLVLGVALVAILGGVVALSAVRRLRRVERIYAEANRTRDDFLAVASHELRTPLTALQLQLQLLTRAMARSGELPASDELERRLTVMEGSSRRLGELVSRLLDVSRAGEGGRIDLAPELLDLTALATDCVGRLHAQVTASGCRVEVRGGSLKGRWDRLRLESVVTNLVDNAAKYGAGQPILVEVADHGPEAVLRVVDRGIGIPAADHRRIFDRFVRAVPAEAYRGLGLGLWLVQAIVEAHGGRIEVESAPGAGSTFTVRLPRGVTPGDRGAGRSPALEPGRGEADLVPDLER